MTRVACNKEGNGNGGKSNGKKGGRQEIAMRVMATAMLTTWAMVTVTKLVCNKEGKSKGGKSNGNGDEDGGQQ